MSLLRLRQPERAPSAVALGVAELVDYRLRFWKRGRDGSGKCTITPQEGRSESSVQGVLFELPLVEKQALDRSEGLGEHYHERQVELAVGATAIVAWTYVAAPDRIDTSLAPFDWYKELVVQGAREHDLAPSYRRFLDTIQAHPDPDPVRARRARTGIVPERLSPP